MNVSQLEPSLAFYQKLGFDILSDHRQENWMVLQHNNLILTLFQGHIDRNLLNFRGGDVEQITQDLKEQGLSLSKPAQHHDDGSWSAEVIDPDGNVIFFNTYPDEREQYQRDNRLLG